MQPPLPIEGADASTWFSADRHAIVDLSGGTSVDSTCVRTIGTRYSFRANTTMGNRHERVEERPRNTVGWRVEGIAG